MRKPHLGDIHNTFCHLISHFVRGVAAEKPTNYHWEGSAAMGGGVFVGRVRFDGRSMISGIAHQYHADAVAAGRVQSDAEDMRCSSSLRFVGAQIQGLPKTGVEASGGGSQSHGCRSHAYVIAGAFNHGLHDACRVHGVEHYSRHAVNVPFCSALPYLGCRNLSGP